MWWPHFRLFLKIVWASLRAVRNPMLLLVTAGFIFTVVGMQLFQRDYTAGVCRISEDCELPRWHMSDFFHTFMMITRTLRGQWIECLWDCMQVTGRASGEALCISFFFTVLVVGYLLVSQNLSHSCQYNKIMKRSLLVGPPAGQFRNTLHSKNCKSALKKLATIKPSDPAHVPETIPP